MCDVCAYYKEHVTMPDYASSGGGRPMTIKSQKGAIFALSQTIIFIDHWLQCFEDNDDNRIVIYK